MARSDTMGREVWRVSVTGPEDRITHQSQFDTEERARVYFAALSISGSVKALEVRQAGAARFRQVESARMDAMADLMEHMGVPYNPATGLGDWRKPRK